jgi:hypothetical protein
MKATRFATCKSICKIIHTARLHIPDGSISADILSEVNISCAA